MGAPVFDAGRRAFPIFQKANNVGNVNWVSLEPAVREDVHLAAVQDRDVGVALAVVGEPEVPHPGLR